MAANDYRMSGEDLKLKVELLAKHRRTTIAKIAKELGLNDQTLRAPFACTNVSVMQLKRYAHYLDCPVGYFFGEFDLDGNCVYNKHGVVTKIINTGRDQNINSNVETNFEDYKELMTEFKNLQYDRIAGLQKEIDFLREQLKKQNEEYLNSISALHDARQQNQGETK